MQELLAQSSFDKLKEGEIVPGTITEIRQNEVVVDIGGKSEGVIPANEFIDIGELQIGSSIDVFVEKLEDKNGAPILSFDKAEQKKNTAAHEIVRRIDALYAIEREIKHLSDEERCHARQTRAVPLLDSLHTFAQSLQTQTLTSGKLGEALA